MTTIRNILNKISWLPFFIFITILLLVTVQGVYGNPKSNELTQDKWMGEGPFQLSPERGRFALTYSIVEDKTFFYSVDLARFTVPDLGIKNGNYVSLFAPGVSYTIIPGYLLGKMFGASQIGSVLVISFFALINTYLIWLITQKTGANKFAAAIAAIVFLFATPAFNYAVTIYQHHISTFLLLLGLLLSFDTKTAYKQTLFWFLYTLAIVIDFPNFFLYLPMVFWNLYNFFDFKLVENKYEIKFYYLKIITMFAMVIPMLFLGWFNQQSYGNPLQLSGTVPSVGAIDAEGKPDAPKVVLGRDQDTFTNPEINQKKSAVGFFKTRQLLNGLLTHFINRDRGTVWFAPVILLGIWGLALLYRSNAILAGLVATSAIVNVLVYSMWGDPWGGWAFGSRYLIPTYAFLAIGIGFLLHYFRKNVLFLLVFGAMFFYSTTVGTLGAITSHANPPEQEAKYLEVVSGRHERFSVDRNWNYLENADVRSVFYNTHAHRYLNPFQYLYILVGAIVLVNLVFLFKSWRAK